jgi:hypothetical protein
MLKPNFRVLHPQLAAARHELMEIVACAPAMLAYEIGGFH